MNLTRSIDLHREALANHIGVGRALALLVTIGLALVITVSLAVAGVVRAGIAPAFDQSIVLDAQHRLVIHNGASPTCAAIPNPPQHDCFSPGPERREFSVDYLTPNGLRSLVWFRLPTLAVRAAPFSFGSEQRSWLMMDWMAAGRSRHALPEKNTCSCRERVVVR